MFITLEISLATLLNIDSSSKPKRGDTCQYRHLFRQGRPNIPQMMWYEESPSKVHSKVHLAFSHWIKRLQKSWNPLKWTPASVYLRSAGMYQHLPSSALFYLYSSFKECLLLKENVSIFLLKKIDVSFLVVALEDLPRIFNGMEV
jgi:hypothetical protein